MQHRDFPGGHPSQYYSGPKALNFRVLMGSGVVALVWPHHGKERDAMLLSHDREKFPKWRRDRPQCVTHPPLSAWRAHLKPGQPPGRDAPTPASTVKKFLSVVVSPLRQPRRHPGVAAWRAPTPAAWRVPEVSRLHRGVPPRVCCDARWHPLPHDFF